MLLVRLWIQQPVAGKIRDELSELQMKNCNKLGSMHIMQVFPARKQME